VKPVTVSPALLEVIPERLAVTAVIPWPADAASPFGLNNLLVAKTYRGEFMSLAM